MADMINNKDVVSISDYIITNNVSLQDIEYYANNITLNINTIDLKNLLLEVGSNIIGMYVESIGDL